MLSCQDFENPRTPTFPSLGLSFLRHWGTDDTKHLICSGMLGRTAGCAEPLALLPAFLSCRRSVLCHPHLAWVHPQVTISCWLWKTKSEVLRSPGSGIALQRSCKWGGGWGTSVHSTPQPQWPNDLPRRV